MSELHLVVLFALIILKKISEEVFLKLLSFTNKSFISPWLMATRQRVFTIPELLCHILPFLVAFPAFGVWNKFWQ